MAGDAEYDDGLDEFESSALVRALRAPGSPRELGGERRVLDAYRSAHTRRSARRLVGRLGVGGTAALATLVLTSGVTAAAYTRTLPQPVQEIAHQALGHLGVPAAPPRAPRPPTVRTAPTSPVGSSATERTGPQATPQRRPRPTGASDSLTAPPSAAPSPTDPTGLPGPGTTPSVLPIPGAGPSGSPAASAPPPEPSATDPVTPGPSVETAVSERVVPVGGSTTLTGVVRDESNQPESGRRVWLLQRVAGGRWHRVSSALTDADGRVQLTTTSLARTTFVRLATGRRTPDPVLRGTVRRIGVRPLISVSFNGTAVTMQVIGADPGDGITVLRARAGHLERLGIRVLDANGRARFDTSGLQGRVRIVVRLPRTRSHAPARSAITIRLAEPSPAPSPSPVSPGAPAGTPGSSTTNGS